MIGLPPSGGFLAKWLLISSAMSTAQWWWGLAMLVGGLLTSMYVFIVVMRAMAPPDAGWAPKRVVPGYQQGAALGLALCSFLLGVAALLPLDMARLGRPPLAWAIP